MTNLVQSCNNVAPIWADAMLAFLWQSTLLVALVAAVLLTWPGLAPTIRCWVWRIIAIKLLLMPFWAVSVSLPERFTAIPQAVLQTAATPTLPQPLPQANTTPLISALSETTDPRATSVGPIAASARLTWQATLLAVWLAVIALQLVRLIGQRIRLSRLLASAQPADDNTISLVAEGCRELRLPRVPQVLITNLDVSPFVCRAFRPLLVLPTSLAVATAGPQLRQIVLHELAHIRRRDLAWCLLMHAMRTAYWFHPIAHVVTFREALERELACDQLAMSHSGATAADYARTLVDAACRAAQPAVLQAAAGVRFAGGHPLSPTRSIPRS